MKKTTVSILLAILLVSSTLAMLLNFSGDVQAATSPVDWNYGLHGNLVNQRVAVNQTGPSNITPKWIFQTGGDVSGCPAVVNGKVYIGSADKHWYCLDAYTGAQIWNFTVGNYVRSSPAVVNGKVYTGADDGYFYCLDANTGAKLWNTSAGGNLYYMFDPMEYQARSSPILVGDNVYVGSLDGNMYCLKASDGTVLHTYNTGSPIFGSPAYANNVIYIVSTNYYLYALNLADLSFKWQSISLAMNIGIDSANRSALTSIYTPTVANGVVYTGAGVYAGTSKSGVTYSPETTPNGAFGGGMRFMAFNASTGLSLWNVTRAGNSMTIATVYWNGQIYGNDYFYETSMNVTTNTSERSGPVLLGDFASNSKAGNRTWAAWLGYQITSNPAYCDDPAGAKIYVGCDIGTFYCLNATNGNTLSVYTIGANVASSPAIYDDKVYVGAGNGAVYCFCDASDVTPTPTPTPTNSATATPEATATATATPTQSAEPTQDYTIIYVAIPVVAVVAIAEVALGVLTLRKRKK